MSKINNLIKELCPNGVKYKTIKEFTKVLRGKRLTTKELCDDASFPVYHGGLDPLGYYHEFNRIGDTVMVINVGASAGTVGYSKCDFWSSDGCYCIEHNDILLNKYLYHYLKNNESYFMGRVRKAGIPTLDASVIEKFKIAIPPLEVQEEIVRILDKFGELEAELEAELEVRKNQYEFWREKIFNNDDNLMAIGDLLESKGYIRGPFGSSLVKADMVSEGIPVYEQQHAIYNHRDFRYFITLEKAKKLERFSIEPDDLIISCSGTVGKVSVILDNDPKGIINQALLILRLNKNLIMPKYMKYYLESPIGYRSITANTNKSAQVNIASRDAIEKIMIPVPSLEEQKRIVDILDTFDALVNDITEGLPAEIKLRRQQYEYYRNKLLSFEEV